MSMKTAVAALRVSSTKQGLQGDSLDDQLVQVQRRAEQLNVKIDKIFTYSQSASGDNQPLQEVLDYCKLHSGQVDYAIVMAIDRITRAGANFYTHLKTELLTHGTVLIDSRGMINPLKINTLEHLGVEYDWSTFSPTYISEILEAERAKEEVRTILTRMLGAVIRYARLGYWRAEPPIGYVNTKQDTEHGRRTYLAQKEDEALWVRRMFELRAQGTMSDHEIVSHINQLGFKSRPRRRLNPKDKTKIVGYTEGKPLNIKQLNRMIERPVYAGFICEKWTDNKLVKCFCEPLVSIDTWNAANRYKRRIVKLEGIYTLLVGDLPDWKKNKDFDNPRYPWRKYVLCPVCRKPFLASASRGKMGKQYPAYHCSRKHKYYRVPEAKMEETIRNFVASLRFETGFWVSFRRIALDEWERRLEVAIKDSQAEESHVLSLKQEKGMIFQRLRQVSHQEAIDYLQSELDKLNQQIQIAIAERNEAEEKELDLEAMIDRIQYFMEHLDELVLNGRNKAKNAELFGLLFDQVPTYEELVNGTPKLCPIFRLNDAFKKGESQLVGCLSSEWNSFVKFAGKILECPSYGTLMPSSPSVP